MDTAIAILTLVWMIGGFILIPVGHAVRASRLYSAAYRFPQRIAKVTSQTAIILVLFSIGYFAYLTFGSGWARYAYLVAPVAGLLVAEEIGKRLYAIPVGETLSLDPPVPHKYRNVSQQIVFENAVKYYAAKSDEAVFTQPVLAKADIDPVTRATVIASYVEEVSKDGWLAIGKQQAQRHELYYQHPAVRNFVIVLVVGWCLLVIVQTGEAFGTAAMKENFFGPVRVIAAFVFGAAFAPTRFLSSEDATKLGSLLILIPVLYLYGWKWFRFVMTGLLIYYFYYSILMLPSNLESWNSLAIVQAFQYWSSWITAPTVGPYIQQVLDWMTGGLYSFGAQAYQLRRIFSLAALLGFSIALWARFFLKFNYHMWFSEAGHVYFEHLMRKPQI